MAYVQILRHEHANEHVFVLMLTPFKKLPPLVHMQVYNWLLSIKNKKNMCICSQTVLHFVEAGVIVTLHCLGI